MDRGRKCMGEVIALLKDSGIVQKAITMRNPQANAMVEHAHQTIHNMLCTHTCEARKTCQMAELAF
jgi:hypothetical protein